MHVYEDVQNRGKYFVHDGFHRLAAIKKILVQDQIADLQLPVLVYPPNLDSDSVYQLRNNYKRTAGAHLTLPEFYSNFSSREFPTHNPKNLMLVVDPGVDHQELPGVLGKEFKSIVKQKFDKFNEEVVTISSDTSNPMIAPIKLTTTYLSLFKAVNLEV